MATISPILPSPIVPSFFLRSATVLLLLAVHSRDHRAAAMYGMNRGSGSSSGAMMPAPMTSSSSSGSGFGSDGGGPQSVVDGDASGSARRGEGWSWQSPTWSWSQGPDGRVQQHCEGANCPPPAGSNGGPQAPPPSPPTGGGGGGSGSMEPPPMDGLRPFGWLAEEARQALIRTCKSGAVKCRQQDQEGGQRRAMVLEQETAFMAKAMAAPTLSTSSSTASQRLDMTYQLKQKMLKAAGLDEHIEPINDGVFEHDILLTEKQSAEMMAALDRMMAESSQQQQQNLPVAAATASPPAVVVQHSVPTTGGYGSKGYGYGRRRRRGLGLILDQLPAQKWDVGQPLAYFFDASLAEYEREMVRQAHRMIEAQTCVRFTAAGEKPAQGPYLFYIKVASPTYCGLSYTGRVEPANPVYLSFACQDPVGIAAHETMHALGANHEHIRVDRDSFIDVQWDNVNPQFYDFFAIADPAKFTPYGIPYDYGSIMHYGAFMTAIDRSRPTMVPRNDPQTNTPLMGQRKRLSAADAQLLNTMYCAGREDPGCTDANAFCGVWALRSYCGSNGWMRDNCRKSCRLCGGTAGAGTGSG